jgi:Fic family protein
MAVPFPLTRAGRFVRQPQGYRAFVPAPLPPDPPLHVDAEMLSLLSRADQWIGRLDGAAQTLPNPELFVAMYVRREAVLSSQIEGTQSTLDDVLNYEIGGSQPDLPPDVEEVVNYVNAMNYGLARLPGLPLSLRLIREIHGKLMDGVRGAEKSPGDFRISQNWIGAGELSIERARFVPPPPGELMSALGDFEGFLHDESLPVLMHCALAHAQFETIHPFLDGNGRVGRLLVTFLLCHRGVLRRPLLYLSHYLKAYRSEYYDRLMAVRETGDWEGWTKFFLRGCAETAEEATATAQAIVDLRERHRDLVQERDLGTNGLRLLEMLFRYPIVSVNLTRDQLRLSFGWANKLIEQFESLGLLHETTGGQRNRRYRYAPYLALFDETRAATSLDVPTETTSSGVDASA